MHFTFTREKPIWVYGYKDHSRELYAMLEESGYQMRGFLDKRADELKSCTMYNIAAPDRKYGDDDVIIINLSSNVSHLQVAEELSQRGCINIIFFPAGEMFDRKKAQIIRKVYVDLLNKKIPFSQLQLPTYSELVMKGEDCNIIRKNSTNVVFWCPSELIYSTQVTELINQAKRMKVSDKLPQDNLSDRWRFDCPLIKMLYDTDDVGAFISYMVYHKGNAQQFIKRTTELLKRNMWEHEIKSYNIWEEEIANGMDYFTELPIQTRWNEKGYFNICDGHHRAMYLLLKEKTEIPISVSSADYKMYEKQVQTIDSWMVTDRKKKKHTILSFLEMQKYIYSNSIEFTKILDVSNKKGYYAANMYKAGAAKCYTSVARNKVDIAFVLSVFDMEQLKKIIINMEPAVLFYESYDFELDQVSEISETFGYNSPQIIYQYYNGKCPSTVMALRKN